MPIVRVDQLQQFAAVNILSDPGAVGGPVVIPFGVQVLLTWNLTDGKQGHNVLYARAATTPNPSVAQAQAIFAALSSGAQWTAMALRMSTTFSFASVTLTSVHSAGLPSFVSTGSAVAGTSATSALPNEMAICVTLRTNLRGASNRGRMFVPGWDTTQVTSANVIAPGAVTDLAAWANTIKGALSAQGLTWAIGQRQRLEYVGNTGTTHPARAANVNVDVQSAIVRDNRWDSQRRRGLR